jgi:hypothetical protein
MANLTLQFCGDPLWVSQTDFLGSLVKNKVDLLEYSIVQYENELDSSASLPPLSWCFLHSVLALVPVLFYLLFLPVLMLQIRISIVRPLPEDVLTHMKAVSSCLFQLIRMDLGFNGIATCGSGISLGTNNLGKVLGLGECSGDRVYLSSSSDLGSCMLYSR